MRRLTDMKDSVIKTVNSAKLIDWVKEKNEKETIRKYNNISKIIRDEEFSVKLEALLSLSEPFVYAVRLLDAAKAGSACLIYKLWNMLVGLIAETCSGDGG
jgi:hypothetical protein